METNKLYIFCDGGSRGNPGPAAIGVVITDEAGKIVKTISRTLGETTNNVAEYMAVVAALEWIKNSYQTSVFSCQFFLDSKLVVNQLNGFFKVKNSRLRNFILKVRTLEQEIGADISYKLISRRHNIQADTLVNKALDEAA